MLILDEIKKGEGKKIEFKRELPNGEAVAKTLIAFSNTGGGKLMIGVEDNGEIIGIDTSKHLEFRDKISNYISDLIAPIIIPNIYTVHFQNRVVLVIEVFRGNMPPYHLRNSGIEKGTYLRIGATNKPADIFAINELDRQKRHTTFDDEINYEYEFNSLDLRFLESEFQHSNISFSIEKLRNLRLIREENRTLMPTNALIILLGLMPFQTVRCSRFKGNNMEVFIDKKEFSGSLFDQLNGIIGFLKNHLFNRAEVVDIRRKERFELPIPLLREIVVNALIHRDYTTNRSDIKVAIYDDRVEFISPGSLPFGLTVDEIVLGGRSESRNPNIANVFRHLHIMEQWGSGIQKVIDVATQIGLEAPEVRDLGNMVGVRFTRPDEDRKEKSFTTEIPVWTINGHPTDEDGRVILNSPESRTTRLEDNSRSWLGESEVGGEIKSKSSKTMNNEALLGNPATRLREETRSSEPRSTRLVLESRSNLSVLEHGEMILAILDVEGQITPRTFADKSGFSVTWTSLLLRDYEERGFLERFGKGRATHYKLNTNGKN